jgi:hypothetical protein
MATTFGMRSLAGAALIACAGAGGCAIDIRADEYTVREEQRFVLAEGEAPDVDLVTFDGSIVVRGWDRSEVRVEVEKAGATREVVDAITVKAGRDGRRIRVEALRPDTGGWMGGVVRNSSHSAKLVVSVPRRCDLRLRSGDGGLTLEGLDGHLDAETGDGSIRGIALAGDLRVRTGDGSIKVEAIDGTIAADTTDGAIVLGGRLRGLIAKTGDGSIAIRLDPGSLVEREWDIATGDGRIAIELPESFAAEIDARTRDGVVRAERMLGLTAEPHTRNVLRGKLGDGGRIVKIRSGDGSISLRHP